MSSHGNLIWIDLEMTGLEPKNDRIIELAIIVTDSDLNFIAEGPVIAIHQPESALEAMDEWNTRTHGNSGLTERVRKSGISERNAENMTLEFLREHLEEGQSPMCGNSIGQDRRFLVKYMPQLEAFFHYRNLDVSSIKELAKRWRPDIAKGFHKKNTHQALDDIQESIAELSYYREHFFKMS
ncbi:MAG: oligoribonuclease [Pseudomonadales bacterium]|nr:oligoribonuclease [Pseudomonadales bacterium]